MMSRLSMALVLVLLIGFSNASAAQVVSYYNCEVESISAFEDALTRFHDAMDGGERPAIVLFEDLWNGESKDTHNLLFLYPDYQSYEAFQNRIAEIPSASLVIERTSEFSICDTEGLAIERGFWGSSGGESNVHALYPITTPAPMRYAEAFSNFASSQVEDGAPVNIGLYEIRAGGDGVNYFVTFGAPTLTVLNEYLDELLQSDEYADFLERDEGIGPLGSGIQRRQIGAWEP